MDRQGDSDWRRSRHSCSRIDSTLSQGSSGNRRAGSDRAAHEVGRQRGWPAFAPDGEQVAFAWSGEKFDNTDIYVTLVGSTAVRRLTTDPAEDYAPSWSPDGRRIAFLRRVGHGARIHVISALGGPDQQVSDFPVAATPPHSLMAVHITWSPDGRYVVAGRDARDVSGDSAGLYLIPIEGGPARCHHATEASRFSFLASVFPGRPSRGVRLV